MASEVVGSLSFGVTSLVRKATTMSGWYYILEHSLGQKKHLRASQGESVSKLAEMSGVSGLSALDQDSNVDSAAGRRILGDVSQSPSVTQMMSLRQIDQMEEMNDTEKAFQKRNLSLRYRYPGIKSAMRYPFTPLKMRQMNRMNSTEKLLTPEREMSSTELDTCSLSSISLCDLTASPGDALFRRNPNQFKVFNLFEEKSSIESEDSTLKDDESTLDTDPEDSSLRWSNLQSTLQSTSSITESGVIFSRMEEECWNIISELESRTQGKSSTTTMYHTTMFDSMSVTIASAKDDSDYHCSRSIQGCQKLLEAEQDFVATMTTGAQHFSRPLHHCILTPHEHKCLFQNCEKIIAIAEFHLKKLSDSLQHALQSDSDIHTAVSSVYIPQIALTCEAYMTYLRGLPAAKLLLSNFMTETEFCRFAQQPVNSVTIQGFLEAPKKHLRNLVEAFEDILSDADAEHPAHHDLKQILKGVYHYVYINFSVVIPRYMITTKIDSCNFPYTSDFSDNLADFKV